VETNAELHALFPKWNMELIHQKTGIGQRHLAAPGELPSDMGVCAAQQLFREHQIDPDSIDFLLFCTQTPDYLLPTTACLIQDRLGLRTGIGALDFNLGCSGFVYGLGLADGLIRAGAAKRVLLITAETYSRYISPDDRSLRTIFGDGAAATLIDSAGKPSLSGFAFGTDGSAADELLMTEGGARSPEKAIQPRKRQRWASPLYMDGPGLLGVTMDIVPKLVRDILAKASLKRELVDYYLLHQATKLLLESVRAQLNATEAQVPIVLEHCGNTVSSTIPIVIDYLRSRGELRPGMQSVLVGFGVGFSWGGCVWRETWEPAT
jgi:3-oxoacyl-[acyl-carrier-protein] synthase-3